MSDVETFADRDALYDAACAALLDGLTAGLAARPRASLAASGGSTPGPVYERLARTRIDWARIDATLVDERCVPADSPESNARLLRETLFVGPARQASFIPLEAAAITPLRPFDAVLLGVGEDGHFASLFPGNPALAEGLDPEGTRLVVEAPAGAPAPPQPRLSQTLAALRDARACVLLVTGDAKRRVLETAEARGLPVAAALRHLRPRVLWAA